MFPGVFDALIVLCQSDTVSSEIQWAALNTCSSFPLCVAFSAHSLTDRKTGCFGLAVAERIRETGVLQRLL